MTTETGPDIRTEKSPPVAIGGLGGSGTRVIAHVVQKMGWFIGDGMNNSLDNFWYVLLFGRRDIVLTSDDELHPLIDLFVQQMSSPRPLDEASRRLVEQCLSTERIQHGAEFLQKSYAGFLEHSQNGTPAGKWGWKVPYTYVLADRLMMHVPGLRYIHISRGGLNMAFSGNQNQLRKWGPLFLNRNVKVGPKDALSFWCAVHRRAVRLSERFPNHVLHIQFEKLVQFPEDTIAQIAEFLNTNISFESLCELSADVVQPKTFQREQDGNFSDFRKEDLNYIQSLGRF